MSSADPIDRYHNLVRSNIFPVLPNNVGRVLDFGGGVGATSAALRRMGRATHVVVADQVGGQMSEVDEACCGDLEDQDFVANILSSHGPFDTILALDILEHLRDPWRIVRLLHHGLVPNGVIVSSIPNVNYHRLVLPLVLHGRYALTDSGILDRTHLRWFARHGAVDLMSVQGLAVEEVLAVVISRREIRLNKLSRGKLSRFLALQYVIRSRRID